MGRALRMQAQLKDQEAIEDGLGNSNTTQLLKSYRSSIGSERSDLKVGKGALEEINGLCQNQIQTAQARRRLVNQVIAHLRTNATLPNGGFPRIRERFRKLLVFENSNRYFLNSSMEKIISWKTNWDKDESNDEAVRMALADSDGD